MSHSDTSEKYAFEAIRRAVGLVVTPYDDGSKPRMVDGIFDRDDGTSGAVEVTRIASPEVMQAEKLMFGDEWRVDGATGGWWVNVDGARVRLDTLRAYLPTLVLESERECVATPHLCARVRERYSSASADPGTSSALYTSVSMTAGPRHRRLFTSGRRRGRLHPPRV